MKATFPKIPPDENGRVLVRCTKTAMKRIEIPYSYGYLKDPRALYGTAKRHESLTFFLESRDAPTLANELAKHWENVKELRHHATERPPVSMMDAFESTLTFFQLQLNKSNEEDGLAAKLAAPLLEDLSPINALKRQWKLLCSHTHPCCVEPLGLAPSEMLPIESQNKNIGYELKSGLDQNLQAKTGRDTDCCVLNYPGEAAELPPVQSPQEYGTMPCRGLLPDVAIFGAGNENVGVVGVPGGHVQTAELPPDSVGTEHHVTFSGGMIRTTSLPSDANLPDEDDFSFFNFDVSDAFSPDPGQGHNDLARTIEASRDGRMSRGPRPPITYPLPDPDLSLNFEDIDLDVLLGKNSERVRADALSWLSAQGSLGSGSKEPALPLGSCLRWGYEEAETVDREHDMSLGLGFGSVGSEDAVADAGSVGKRNTSAKPSYISVTCGAREDFLDGGDVESMNPDDVERKPQPVRRLSSDLEYKDVGRLLHTLPSIESRHRHGSHSAPQHLPIPPWALEYHSIGSYLDYKDQDRDIEGHLCVHSRICKSATGAAGNPMATAVGLIDFDSDYESEDEPVQAPPAPALAANANHRPMVGGFAAAAYEAHRRVSIQCALGNQPVPEAPGGPPAPVPLALFPGYTSIRLPASAQPRSQASEAPVGGHVAPALEHVDRSIRDEVRLPQPIATTPKKKAKQRQQSSMTQLVSMFKSHNLFDKNT
jgi:hypothetical protein